MAVKSERLANTRRAPAQKIMAESGYNPMTKRANGVSKISGRENKPARMKNRSTGESTLNFSASNKTPRLIQTAITLAPI
jgi:hypothetical protein